MNASIPICAIWLSAFVTPRIASTRAGEPRLGRWRQRRHLDRRRAQHRGGWLAARPPAPADPWAVAVVRPRASEPAQSLPCVGAVPLARAKKRHAPSGIRPLIATAALLVVPVRQAAIP